MALQFFAASRFQFKLTARICFNVRHRAISPQFDARIGCRSHQAVDDGLRGIRYGEHAPIGFSLELYSSRFKPGDCIHWLKRAERPEQRLVTTRVEIA